MNGALTFTWRKHIRHVQYPAQEQNPRTVYTGVNKHRRRPQRRDFGSRSFAPRLQCMQNTFSIVGMIYFVGVSLTATLYGRLRGPTLLYAKVCDYASRYVVGDEHKSELPSTLRELTFMVQSQSSTVASRMGAMVATPAATMKRRGEGFWRWPVTPHNTRMSSEIHVSQVHSLLSGASASRGERQKEGRKG